MATFCVLGQSQSELCRVDCFCKCELFLFGDPQESMSFAAFDSRLTALGMTLESRRRGWRKDAINENEVFTGLAASWLEH
jgi:hypothetical protein